MRQGAADGRDADVDPARGRSIIFVNRFFHPDHSATSQILSDLAFDMARDSFRVQVVTARGLYDDPHAVLAERETIGGVEIHRVFRPRFGRASITGRAIDYLAMYRAFASTVYRIAQPGDIVVAKTDPPLLSVALAPVVRRRRAKLVNWLQDLYPEVALGLGMNWLRPAAPLLKAARNLSLKSAACNVAIGDLMAARLFANGVAKDQIAVIANWCDDHEIDPALFDRNPLRAAWGLEGKFVVGYSGNLGRAHEFQTILHAAERLRHADDVVFLFIGGGQLSGQLRTAVESAGLSDRFQFRPYQEARLLPQSLTLPDVHWLSLIPSMEGLIVPSKFYGIAAAGRPVIAVTDRDGEIARLVRVSNCGRHVEPGDGQAFANVVDELRRDRQRVEIMGANARVLLDSTFQRQTALARWRDLVGSLTSAA